MTTIALKDRFSTRARAFWAATRLGWAIESNWTDPFVFLTYQIVRPLFGALILVVMYHVVRGVKADPGTFAQIYVANAFFIIVLQSLIVIGSVVFEDRERYEMLRYVYLAPMGLGPYILARGASHVTATSASVLITLLMGVICFNVHLHLHWIGVPYFVVTLFLGIIATLALGLMLAGLTMLLAHHGMLMPEGVSGVLYLCCGVVFSIDMLPGPLAAIGRLMPWTYWLEGFRRVFLGSTFNPSLASLSDGMILLRLTLLTAATCVVGWSTLMGAQRIAVARGKLDEKTDH